MAIKLVSRRAWGARSPRSAAGRLSSTRGVKVHYTGDHVDPALADHHERCDDRVRAIQDAHMDGNGWNDIGYSMVVCPHGYAYMGRGPHALPAANGPGLNSGHYAVCGIVGAKGLTEPTDAMLNGIRDAIEYLREEGDAGGEIKGHRDGYATDCPGEPLYAWVGKGAPRPADGGDTGDTEDETLQILINLGASQPMTVQPGQRGSLAFDREYYDKGDVHTDGGYPSWFPKESAYYLVTTSMVVEGQAAGDKLKILFSAYERDTNDLVKDSYGEDKVGNGTPVEFTLSGLVWMDADHKYRVDVENFGTAPLTITSAALRIAR